MIEELQRRRDNLSFALAQARSTRSELIGRAVIDFPAAISFSSRQSAWGATTDIRLIPEGRPMSDPTRELTSRSTLETIRRQAKRWLKEIEAGAAGPLARFRKLMPGHAGAPKLREVQHALARDYGLANWAALKQELAARE
eukprot:gene35124-45010_t